MDTATREIYWQISNLWLFYSLSMFALLVFLWGIIKSVRFILQGTVSSVRPAKKPGIRSTAVDIILHKILEGENKARWWHLLLFYGCLLLFLVTCYIMLAHYGFEQIFTGVPYLLLTLVADLAGAAVMAGILIALIKSLEHEPEDRDRVFKKRTILFLLGAIVITGFLVEGLRIHLQGDPWQTWSPVGAAVSWLFHPASGQGGHLLFKILWWLHGLLALGLLALIPYTPRLRHMFFLPVNRSMTPLEPRSPTPFTDLQALHSARPSPGSVRLGIETASDTTKKQRLGLLSCMECGRCERLCPAFQTGQPLSPRGYLQDLREYVCLNEKQWMGPGEKSMVPAVEAVTPDSLWACRLCRACEELCPAGIEHVPQIIEMRRGEVLGKGRLPQDGAAALRNLTRTGNPYGVSPEERLSWIREQRIPDHLTENPGKKLLLWTGCFQPGDEQKPKILSCLVELLKKLEIPFFTLQESASCCGDPARILGEEDVFQSLAREQIQKIQESGAEEILVHCPHCYTVLKDIYPLLGARFSVQHTSTFFQGLLREKRLQIQGSSDKVSVIYHDPCFLGRYQEIFEPPREILQSLPGLELHDPPRCRNEGYCCGAGGGHFFMDLDLQERPSSQRMEEILAQEAEVLAVSCSFCFSMFDDALRRLPDPPSLRIADWLELLKEATVFPTSSSRP